MGDLSDNFSRREFECHGENCCSHTSTVNERLVIALESFRAIVKQPVSINSGFRCLTHNRSIGSKDSSQHVWGNAADIPILEGMTVDEMVAAAKRCPSFFRGGIGIYDWGIHVDVRMSGPQRWDKR